MKLKIVVNKEFQGHKGIPGHLGGSLPKDEYPVLNAPMTAIELDRELHRKMVPINYRGLMSEYFKNIKRLYNTYTSDRYKGMDKQAAREKYQKAFDAFMNNSKL